MGVFCVWMRMKAPEKMRNKGEGGLIMSECVTDVFLDVPSESPRAFGSSRAAIADERDWRNG
jgi:hypothetical protein